MAKGERRMLPNQILHRVIQDIYRITGQDCGVWDRAGHCLAMTGENILLLKEEVKTFSGSGRETQLEGGKGCFLAGAEGEYILTIRGQEGVERSGCWGVSQLNNLLLLQKERLDKGQTLLRIMREDLSESEILQLTHRLRLAESGARTLFLIEARSKGKTLIPETLRGLYGNGSRDFIIPLDERRTILVKSLDGEDTKQQRVRFSHEILDTLQMEAMVGVRVACARVIFHLRDLKKAYETALTALEVGKIFYEEKNLLTYGELGVGHLIHQLPRDRCQMFLKEVFLGEQEQVFEEEELTAIYTFFECSLNISEAARRLFVHRNTLVHRLERIQKKTGLDIRVFEDALTLKIAMMVSEHNRYLEKKEAQKHD